MYGPLFDNAGRLSNPAYEPTSHDAIPRPLQQNVMHSILKESPDGVSYGGQGFPQFNGPQVNIRSAVIS